MAHPAGSQGFPLYAVSITRRGLRLCQLTSYNVRVMLIAANGPEESQFAFARVLATLPGVPAALSVKFAFASASQPLR